MRGSLSRLVGLLRAGTLAIGLLRAGGLAIGWLACAVAIAAGSAGIVAATSLPAGSGARPELTWAADEAVRPGLAAAVDDLTALQADIEGLGRAGRGALAALAQGDSAAVAVAVSDGTTRIARIDAATAALGGQLADLPGLGPGMEARLGPDVRAEDAAIVAALETTSSLGQSWAVLTAGSAAADRLTTLLARHDQLAAEAVRTGSTGSYGKALATVDRASEALDGASDLRDAVANTADVSMLDEWIARNRAIDTALRALYGALAASKGTVTPDVRAALTAERAAQADLPPDTRGLVVIMSDISRGGLNQAVIAIEDARGRLAAALAAIRAG